MTEYNSLNHFKANLKVSDNNGNIIASIFQELYHAYSNGEFYTQKNVKLYLDELLEECKKINPTLIPYAEITNIIFAQYFDRETETSFTEKFKSEFEKHIIIKFNKQSHKDDSDRVPQSTEELFESPSRTNEMNLSISNEYSDSILVIYKIIQHAELAISQKQSLYQSLRDEIYALDNTVYSATNKYDNMMSNFISILGIFAAIMMATFGAIQGFTAIYSNENNYNLTKIILISCFGLFALISVIYLLLNSISKLIDKEFSDMSYSNNFFAKHPIYFQILLLISIIFLGTLTHLFKTSPPDYLPDHLAENIWEYTLLISIFAIIVFGLHLLIEQSSGYGFLNRHLNNYIMDIKDKIGLKKLLNLASL